MHVFGYACALCRSSVCVCGVCVSMCVCVCVCVNRLSVYCAAGAYSSGQALEHTHLNAPGYTFTNHDTCAAAACDLPRTGMSQCHARTFTLSL